MELVCRTNVSKYGNSRAVIIPKNVEDFPIKSKIDLYKTDYGILIRPVRSVSEWSAERQSAVINDILAFAGSNEDNEPLTEKFIEQYCNDDNNDDLDFSGMEGE
jgi:antitoxin component of MazEF toxin-antitoxin module